MAIFLMDCVREVRRPRGQDVGSRSESKLLPFVDRVPVVTHAFYGTDTRITRSLSAMSVSVRPVSFTP